MTRLTAVFFALAALLSVLTVTLAAYTSLTSVKRVVTVRGSEQYFTSDVLLAYQDDKILNRIQPFNEADTNKVITLTVANHLQEDKNAFDGKDIRYTLEITLLDAAGQPIPKNDELYQFIQIDGTVSRRVENGFLEGGISRETTYQIKLMDNRLLQYRLQVVAEAANRKEYLPLGRIFLLSSSDTTAEWTGRFLDTEKSVVEKSDALAIINYQITGQVEGDYVLSWNSDRVIIDPTFLSRVNKTTEDVKAVLGKENQKFLTLHLGADGTPLQYIIPFYRTYAQKDLPKETWQTIETYITFTKAGGEGA